MGTIKDKGGRDLVDTEEIKKRWKEYTEELNKKYLNEPDNHDDLVSHLWIALESMQDKKDLI